MKLEDVLTKKQVNKCAAPAIPLVAAIPGVGPFIAAVLLAVGAGAYALHKHLEEEKPYAQGPVGPGSHVREKTRLPDGTIEDSFWIGGKKVSEDQFYGSAKAVAEQITGLGATPRAEDILTILSQAGVPVSQQIATDMAEAVAAKSALPEVLAKNLDLVERSIARLDTALNSPNPERGPDICKLLVALHRAHQGAWELLPSIAARHTPIGVGAHRMASGVLYRAQEYIRKYEQFCPNEDFTLGQP